MFHVNNSLSGRWFFLASRLTIVSLDSIVINWCSTMHGTINTVYHFPVIEGLCEIETLIIELIRI